MARCGEKTKLAILLLCENNKKPEKLGNVSEIFPIVKKLKSREKVGSVSEIFKMGKGKKSGKFPEIFPEKAYI